MKVVILAGGFGTRIAEETHLKPKPMVEVGGKPLLWHVMKIYSHYGLNDFIICLGYKGYIIKEYFSNYLLHMSDVTIDMKSNAVSIHQRNAEPWCVTLIDTGEFSMTGGRLKKIASYIDDEDFCFTYGDGVADINIRDLLSFHRHHGKYATITATKPPSRFGRMKIDRYTRHVETFREKSDSDTGWVNGGFFVLSPNVFDYIEDEQTIWEKEPLEQLSKDQQLCAYHHNGFWQPMDTLREKQYLEQLWESNGAPWKMWSC